MKRFLFLLSFVFTVLSAPAFAAGQSAVAKEKSVISQEQKVPVSEQIATIRSLMNSFVKVNENVHPVFHNLHPTKRFQSYQFSAACAADVKACYSAYNLLRRNSLHAFPLYIKYRRLTI